MRVLITGGAGFIGSHLADRLLDRGEEVLVVDNYATGRRDNLRPHSNLKIVEGTIADKKLVDSTFDDFRPDLVVHAAASYKDPDNWVEDARTNALGTAIVVDSCEHFKIERLIYFQTALCYGLQPLEQPITINHPILPGNSSYAISKTAGEQYIQLGASDYISFRLANAYGPRNMSGPLPTFYHRLSNGKPCFVMDTRRDFIYIDDLIDIVMLSIDGNGQKGVYHVSSGTDYSIKELFDATLKALKIVLQEEIPILPRGEADAYTILLDPKKTLQEFNWKTTISLEAGVDAAVKYYQEFGISETYTHLRISEKSKKNG